MISALVEIRVPLTVVYMYQYILPAPHALVFGYIVFSSLFSLVAIFQIVQMVLYH